MFPNIMSYKLTMLQNIYHKFINDGKIGLEFSEPKQALLIVCDDKRLLYLFFRQLKTIIAGKNVNIRTHLMPKTVPTKKVQMNRFDPMALQFSSIQRFDNRILNMRHLKTLLLEDCDLPKIPFQIGQLSLEYFSISGSKLPTSKNEQDVLWNWTSITTICNSLRTLKMDSIGLKTLPFEISFLKNLETLSARNNKLSYLPQIIGELKKLECLFVADNSIKYFPHILSSKIFKEIDISNNLFQLPRSLEFDHIKIYLDTLNTENLRHVGIKPLSHLAFNNILDNLIPFKRQDLPRSLWTHFDVVGRCMLCNKWILPNYSRVTHTFGLPKAKRIIKDQRANGLPWQSLICRYSAECGCPY